MGQLKYLEYNDNTGLLRALQSKEVDWAQIFITDYQKNYVDKDPKHNVFWGGANVLSPDMVLVNTTKAPFNDVAFRKAVNMVVDRKAHAEKARSNAGPELTSVTGIPQPTGDQYIAPPEYKDKTFSIDVDGAKKVLTDAGYTWKDGALIDPSGNPRLVHAAGSAGLERLRHRHPARGHADQEHPRRGRKVATPDADTWFTNMATGNFDAALHWSGSGSNPWHIYDDVMNGAYLAQAADGKVSDNFGRYSNPEATALLAQYAQASDDATRTEALNKIQKIFVDDVPRHPDRHPPAARRVQHPHLHRVAEREGPVRDGRPDAALGGPGDHEPEAGRQVVPGPPRVLRLASLAQEPATPTGS